MADAAMGFFFPPTQQVQGELRWTNPAKLRERSRVASADSAEALSRLKMKRR